MTDITIGSAESRFADLIWENEPIPSTELQRLSEKELGWKKSTSFTVLRRLCEKGIFKNEKSTVTSLISRDDFYAHRSEKFVEEAFGGSLPAFLAAFSHSKTLSKEEIDELQKLIDSYKGE